MNRLLRAAVLLGALVLAGCAATAVGRSVLSRDSQISRSLPPFSRSYRTYSLLGSALGRQYAAPAVIETLEGALADIHAQSGRRHEIAEIGWRGGGRFWPHATHQTGTSVDIMTPMRDPASGAPRRLWTGPLSLFGYCWHINPDSNQLSGLAWDAPGRALCPTVSVGPGWSVDFDALRALLTALDAHARRRGGRVRVAIVAPSFVGPLRGVGVPLSTRAWIVHDDHVHVEFAF